ncbi:MAG: energy transducer TonB [Bryobacteraceae bacterium]
MLIAAGALFGEIRVSTADAVKNAVKKAKPEYSSMARQMRIEGDVEVEVHITADGDVGDVKPLSGNPILTSIVTKALKDWKFAPFTAEGKPVAAVTALRFSFKL